MASAPICKACMVALVPAPHRDQLDGKAWWEHPTTAEFDPEGHNIGHTSAAVFVSISATAPSSPSTSKGKGPMIRNTRFKERTLSDMHVRAEFGVEKFDNQAPYFTVTGSVWNNKAHARRWPGSPERCGQVTEEILRAFPDLADLVALHLSTIEGAPMHAEANAWHWYEQGKLDVVARHLRTTVDDLPVDADRATLADYVEAQRPRWKAEADAAIAKYSLSVSHG
jgi:hypothetical protein